MLGNRLISVSTSQLRPNLSFRTSMFEPDQIDIAASTKRSLGDRIHPFFK